MLPPAGAWTTWTATPENPMTRKKKIIIAVLVLGINAWVLVGLLLAVHRYEVKLGSFGDLEEFVKANGERAPLWLGTYYQGDYNGRSYFRHEMMLGRSCTVSVPADSWTYTPRYEQTSRRKEWLEWSSVKGAGNGAKAERE